MKLVLCNCPPAVSQELAKSLVNRQLAACVNISQPIQSVYRWEGEVCQEEECTLIIKCAEDTVRRLVAILADEHPYDVPEILVTEVNLALSHAPYVDWVRAECVASQ